MLNERLRIVRMARGFSLAEAASAAKVSLRSYQRYESGTSQPSCRTLTILADFFHVPVDFLLGRDEYLRSIGVVVDISTEIPPRHGSKDQE